MRTHTHTGTHCIGKTDVLKFPMHILNTWAIFVVMFVSAKRKKKRFGYLNIIIWRKKLFAFICVFAYIDAL